MDSDLAKIVTGSLVRIEQKLDRSLEDFGNHKIEEERRYGEHKADSNARKAEIEQAVRDLHEIRTERTANRRWWLGILSGLIVLLLAGAASWVFSMTRLGQMIERIEKKEARP